MGGMGTRGAHRKHVVHSCDFGRVETQRLVERRRPLPSPKGGMLRGRHAGREDGRGVDGAAGSGLERPIGELAQGHALSRTLNM